MKSLLAAFSLMTLLVFSGCGGEEKPINVKAKTDLIDTADLKHEIGSDVFNRGKQIFYALPSPVELQLIVEQAGGYFMPDILLDAKQSSLYQGTLKEAIAMGILGTDLSYSAVYNNRQESILFLAAMQRVAKTMGITEPFQGHLVERANNNLDNKDSMMVIISEMYWEMNSQLEEENRKELGIVVLTSGWIEGLHIGTNILEASDPKDGIAQIIAEQRYIAAQLNTLLQSHLDDPLIAEAAPLFQPVLDAYMELDVMQEKAEVRQENGKTVIGGSNEVKFDANDLANIKATVAEVRSKLIAP